MSEPIMQFRSREEADAWMLDQVNDNCVNNERFAFKDDESAMAAYGDAQNSGCCGSFDSEVEIGGRTAMIGCNYGH